MQKIVNVTIDGIKFKIKEFQWEKSLEIQKTTMITLSPVLNILGLNSGNDEEDDNKSLLDKIKIDNLGNAIRDCLLSIDNPFSFFKQVFENTYVIKKNQSGQEGEFPLTDSEILNETFHKKTMTAVKLVIEVLKVNELLFSNGLGGFGKIIGSLMSTMQK